VRESRKENGRRVYNLNLLRLVGDVQIRQGGNKLDYSNNMKIQNKSNFIEIKYDDAFNKKNYFVKFHFKYIFSLNNKFQ